MTYSLNLEEYVDRRWEATKREVERLVALSNVSGHEREGITLDELTRLVALSSSDAEARQAARWLPLSASEREVADEVQRLAALGDRLAGRR